MTIIGVWYTLAGVALLAPRFPRVKEWAYAGLVINYTGALASHLRWNLVPVLRQAGTRLFEHLGPDRVELERTRAILPSSGVTHLSFRIPRRR
jgi:hypothetical protein